MIDPTGLPEATAPREHHADFLELSALKSTRGSVSVQEFIRDLKMANATEAVADSAGYDREPEPDDLTEAIAEAAFSEADDRERACGVRSRWYPFKISTNTMTVEENTDGSLYTFLALLSWFGKDAGASGTSGDRLFEEISAKASEAYLGGPNQQVKSFVFGFPRRVLPKGFKAALDTLCTEMGEGSGHHTGRPKLPHEKDAKLDVVAWREFEDQRQGKLIAFGQCATGRDWAGKVIELPSPVDWCTTWMADRPSVWPVRAFFVPHRVDRVNWFDTCVKGGLLYDRCRIASLASDIDQGLRTSWAKWSSSVLQKLRRT